MADFIQVNASPVMCVEIEYTQDGEQISQGELIEKSDLDFEEYQDFESPEGPLELIHDPICWDAITPLDPYGQPQESDNPYDESEYVRVQNCIQDCMGWLDPATAVFSGAAGAYVGINGLPYVTKISKVARGFPILPGSSPYTSIFSIWALKHKGSIWAKRLPVWARPIQKVTGTPIVGRATGRIAARFIPGVGWGLLAADLVVFQRCRVKCRDKRNIGQVIRDAFTAPAY